MKKLLSIALCLLPFYSFANKEKLEEMTSKSNKEKIDYLKKDHPQALKDLIFYKLNSNFSVDPKNKKVLIALGFIKQENDKNNPTLPKSKL